MTLQYFESKPLAQAALGRLFDGGDQRILTGDIQFEPGKGFVVVLVVAATANVDDLRAAGWDIQPWKAERDTQPTASHAPKAPRPSPAPGSTPTAPSKGATARVWEIADGYVATAGQVNRAAIIAACEQAGINSATAGTQYSKWKKARGL
jgi:hypothetical protein